MQTLKSDCKIKKKKKSHMPHLIRLVLNAYAIKKKVLA